VDQLDDLDGPAASPEHHRVLFENDRVRVLETLVPPGETTAVHTHLAPSAMYVVSGSHFIRRDPSGQVMLDTRTTDPPFEWPRVLWSDGTPAHTLENSGDTPLIVISVELRGPVPGTE
jgi:hypothetical protein